MVSHESVNPVTGKSIPHIKALKWAVGLTCTPQRRKDLLPRTLLSLQAGGFDLSKLRLFVDGDSNTDSWRQEFGERFGIDQVTSHYPTIRTHGNWILGAMELFIREPYADRYAMFQDDFVTYRNLKSYLEWCEYPAKGYWNLYTFPSNQTLAPKTIHGGTLTRWYLSDQLGKGAVAVIFSREVLLEVLLSRHMVERPLDAHRGHKAVDGGIVTALKKAGYQEYVHSPSLVQHTGLISSMGNRPHVLANSFRLESFDALDLIGIIEEEKRLGY